MARDRPASDPDRDDVMGPGELARSHHVRGTATIAPGAGCEAAAPSEIPVAGWRQVLGRVWRETISDQTSMVAASCAFYPMLALFPGISVLISLYGLALNAATIGAQIQAVRDVLPAAAFDLVTQRLHDLASRPAAELSWGLVLGVLVALWSASAGTKALMSALNVAYEEQEKRGLISFNLTALFFTLCGILGVVVALGLIVGLPTLLRLDLLGTPGRIAARAVSYAVMLICVIVGLALLYRFAPSRRQAHWRWITPGSLLPAVMWLLASILFSLYIGRFASYDAIYGPLGAVAVLLLGFYISAFVVMLGAELNAELELQTSRGTTKGRERPLGKRVAFVADHVAAAPQG
jgi:membrane protein